MRLVLLAWLGWCGWLVEQAEMIVEDCCPLDGVHPGLPGPKLPINTPEAGCS